MFPRPDSRSPPTCRLTGSTTPMHHTLSTSSSFRAAAIGRWHQQGKRRQSSGEVKCVSVGVGAYRAAGGSSATNIS